MYQLVVGIQIISIAILLVECWIVFTNWRSTLHSYLFLGCVSTLVNNIGYLAQLLSRTQEAYCTAWKLSYLGRVWIAFALFMFITELVGIRLPLVARTILAAINVVTYFVVFTNEYTGLYYKKTEFLMQGSFPVLLHENGIWHHVWDAVLVLYVLYGLTALIIFYKREKDPTAAKRLLMVVLAVLTQGVFLFIQMFKPIELAKVYDVTVISFPIAAVFILVAILRYRLLNTATIAREYVIDELTESIIAVDHNGQIGYYNNPAHKLFPELAWSSGTVIDTISKAIESGEPIKREDRIYTAEANPLTKDGQDAGTLYSLTDDTEHYRYMEQLEEQKRLADDANRAKSSFLANMSHEIRTPINAVLGMDEMILRESNEKEILSYAGYIQTAGRTLLSLINDILDFSKIEEGRMEILPTQYELASCINDIVNMIRERAEKKGLKFSVKLNGDTPRLLYGDEIRIKQIALNLLTNAVKYTDAGEVGLDINYSECPETPSDIMLEFRISDTGIGMKEEDMAKLFSPFTRIEEKRNRSIEGTGLGMSIVRQLLSLMGSELNVKSVYGEGSEFSYGIRQRVIAREPVGDLSERFDAALKVKSAYKELFHAPDARILVVDDTEVNLEVIKNLLKKTRINIDTAGSGMAALSLAKDRDYDIVFIDHMMPDMDGIETLRRMKEECSEEAEGKDKDGAHTVHIALTANAVSGARELYLSAGFDDYLSKPVDGRRLEEIIRKYLPADKIRIQAAPGPDGESHAPAADSNERKILVVDDDEVICTTSKEILSPAFTVICCTDGNEALNIASNEKPDLILLDINLVGMNGFEILQELKEDVSLRDIPVMFITADEDREKEALGLKSGALDFIRKPFIPEVLMQRSKRIIALDRYQKDLQGEVRSQTKRAERLTKEMMMALSHTVDAKDHYTNGHSERVAAYAAEMGRRMGKSAKEQIMLYEIGLLHDIGKIGISEEIINKTEKLTKDEFGEIKEHTVIGHEILKGIADMPELSAGARSHHEKYDGSGYPDGLAGEDIPEIARIICVADCYDAMTSTRTYSDPKPQAKVRAEIVRCSGTHFDPVVAAVMLEMIDDDKEFTMTERGGSVVWRGKEQLWDSDPAGTVDIHLTEGEDKTELPGWLKETEGIDTDQGILNCGSAESYLSVLKTFYKTAKSKADEIESLHESGDVENYTIKVHALKSSARIIGAAKLSDMAKTLEEAGKAGDTDTIDRDTDALLEKYRSLYEDLNKIDEDEKELKELSPRMRREAFTTISEIAQSMDFGLMEGLIKDLKGYRLSDEDEKLLGGMEDMLMQLDWDGISDSAKKALETD